jgi:hypothetical protein
MEKGRENQMIVYDVLEFLDGLFRETIGMRLGQNARKLGMFPHVSFHDRLLQ